MPTEPHPTQNLTKLLQDLSAQLNATYDPAVRLHLLKMIRLILDDLDHATAEPLKVEWKNTQSHSDTTSG